MNAAGRSRRVLLVGVALVALLGIVAYASHSGVTRGGGSAAPTPGYVSWMMSVFLVLFVLMIPYTVWVYLQQTHERLASGQRSFQARVARSLAFLFVIVLIGLGYRWVRHHTHLGNALPHFHLFGSSAPRRLPPGGHARPAEPRFEWPVLWATLVLAAAAVGAWWWSLRRRGSLAPLPQAAEGDLAEEVSQSIGDAIDDLEAEPDARRAVIAAYARMEGVLARQGAGRRASETPLEYLRRVLLELTAERLAVGRLTDLFEEAKFSRHEIDSSMKRDAIDALRAIRDDLQGAPA
ncbi:MAG TPA: DUF4129 domain-containing protein [Gaiellaceae bacterium]|nr:DUF4129 domain-containing protein [Gaiellaceae bacterium]